MVGAGTMAVVDHPSRLPLRLGQPVVGIEGGEERCPGLVQVGDAVEEPEVGVGTVDVVGDGEGAEVAVLLQGGGDGRGDVGVAAGRGVDGYAMADGVFQHLLGVAHFEVDVFLDDAVCPGVVADAPAHVDQLAQFVGAHVMVAVVAGVADAAHFVHLPDYDLDMAGYAQLLVQGDDMVEQLGERLVVGDRVGPLFAVFERGWRDADAFSVAYSLF